MIRGLALLPLQIPRSHPFFSLDESIALQKFPRILPAVDLTKIMPNSRPRAASLGGSSSAEYSEQLLGMERKKKRQSVAGVDQDELLDPEMLADPDSCFCEFKGVKIHHKIYHEEEIADLSIQHWSSSSGAKTIGFPMILLHGFGASVFSWNKVMKPLAQVVGAKVLSFDRPAFGLTSRVSSSMISSSDGGDAAPLNPYSMAFSVLATLYFINFLAADKAILVGHSAGCLVAVETYFESPERVAAMILVAPAILAPRVSAKGPKNQKTREKMADGGSDSNVQENLFMRLCEAIKKSYLHFARVIMQMLKGMMNMVSSLYRKALSAILRSAFAIVLLRMIMDKFGIPAIRNAWYDADQIGDHILHGYTKPLRVKDWDKALLDYTVAMLTDSSSESKPPLARRLNEIRCPVLVITGDSDRIVPSWNAEQLSKAIPGSNFELIKKCGHLPHEERVEEFVFVVKNFLLRVFGTHEQISPVTA